MEGDMRNREIQREKRLSWSVRESDEGMREKADGRRRLRERGVGVGEME